MKKILIASLLILVALGFTFPAHLAFAKNSIHYPFVTGELVVRAKPTTNKKTSNFESIAQDLQSSLGSKSLIKVKKFKTSEEFAVLQLSEADKSNAMKILKQDARVLYSEPNYIYHIVGDGVPNDAQFSELWGMKNVGQADGAGQVGKADADIHVTPVWAEGNIGSAKVKVAVIDTGVDYTHPDLKDNIWNSPADPSVHGWNFVKNNNDPKDDHNHGTHCAGTIGGIGNNGFGVAGVNWKVSIIPVKFLDDQGSGTLDAAVQAIQYATSMGVDIMSNSWGGGPFTQSLYDAIAAAKAKGILFIAAAGNDGGDNDAQPSYPASYQLDNIISVAATDNRDQIASFSNYGKTSVHVAAPGVKILSTIKDGSYGVLSGTSMATPHISGIAALLLSIKPTLTYAQIKDILIRSSDKLRGFSRKVAAGGRVNVYNAVHGIFPVIQKPDETLWKDYAYLAETPHPYENSKIYNFDINVPQAKYIRVVFESIDTEAGIDKISIKDSTQDEIEDLSGVYSNYTTDYLVGPSAKIVFTTDDSVIKNGFKVKKLQVIY